MNDAVVPENIPLYCSNFNLLTSRRVVEFREKPPIFSWTTSYILQPATKGRPEKYRHPYQQILQADIETVLVVSQSSSTAAIRHWELGTRKLSTTITPQSFV